MFLFLIDKDINLFEISLIINSGENTWRITKQKIQVIPISSYEKTDKRLIFHARMSNKAALPAVIVARDANVFLLLTCALSQWECVSRPWYMQIDSAQFININIVFDYVES